MYKRQDIAIVRENTGGLYFGTPRGIVTLPDGRREAVNTPVSYTHLRAHETVLDLVCRLLLENKKKRPHDCPNSYLSGNYKSH